MSTTDQTAAARCPVIDFDHHRPIAEVHPDDAYRELRQRCPVGYTEAHDGYWVVSKHEDVSRVLKDYETFSSSANERTGNGVPFNIPSQEGFGLMIPEQLDPPEFQGFRRLLNGILSPKAVAAMQDRIEYWASWHIDQVIEAGHCDMVNDLASPMTGAITLEWIGFPQHEWRRITDAFHDVNGYLPDSPEGQRAWADILWLNGRIEEEVAARREAPRDDVITWLIQQEVDGEPIREDYLHGILRILIGGGVDTATSLMSSTMVHLSAHPEHRDRLIADPELWTTATEEFLRRYPPVRAHARTVTKDVEIGGRLLRKGDRVLASESSACHDEEAFENPMDVILDRFPNRHVGFGLGIHRCAGMHLARAEYRELMRQVLERMPDYRVDPERAAQYPHQSQIAGWTTAPASFTPGPRVLPADAA